MIGDFITGMLTAEESMTLGLMGTMLIIYALVILFAIGLYIYSAFALMAIAKKTKTEPEWLAWIPVANAVLISKIAKMHWWPILLMVPAFIFYVIGIFFYVFGSETLGIVMFSIAGLAMAVFGVYSTIWCWKMFEAVQRPGWWSIVPIPFGIIYIIATFSKSGTTQLVGNLLYILGMLVYLVLFGVSAWSEASNNKTTISKKRT